MVKGAVEAIVFEENSEEAEAAASGFGCGSADMSDSLFAAHERVLYGVPHLWHLYIGRCAFLVESGMSIAAHCDIRCRGKRVRVDRLGWYEEYASLVQLSVPSGDSEWYHEVSPHIVAYPTSKLNL